MFFTSYFYKLSMNIFFQFDFMLMKLPAFWSSVSAIVKFCIFSIPSQESVAFLWFIGCVFLVMVFSSLNFMREIWFVWVLGVFWGFWLWFCFFGHKILLWNSSLFFNAALKNSWKQSKQDLEHGYSSLLKNNKKWFCSIFIFTFKFNWCLLKQ